MLRLFVAIDLPEALAPVLERLRDGNLHVRWTPADQYHVTLRFVGDVQDDTAHTIASSLETVNGPPFQMEIAGVDVFPSLHHPRVLVAVVRPNEQLSMLQRSVESAVEQAGIEPDKRAFHPHLTIGRVRHARPADIASYLQRHGGFSLPTTPVERFHLYQSELTRAGAMHTRLTTYALRGGP